MTSSIARFGLSILFLLAGTFSNWAAGQAAATVPPYCAHVPSPSKSLEGAQTYTYRLIDKRDLRIHVFAPQASSKKRPAAIFLFGGGFRLGDAASFRELALSFAARGYVAAVPDYRVICRDNVGATGGVDDAEAALKWLRGHAKHFQIDEKRIVLIGASAGGLLAASTALRMPAGSRPAALVLFNPVLDLEAGAWSGDQNANQASEYSPSRLPVQILPPTIVFHGTEDQTVPIRSSRDFCRRAVRVGRTCDLVEYPGRDHSFSAIRTPDPATGVSPADDTMRRSFEFLEPVTRVGGTVAAQPVTPAATANAPTLMPDHYTTGATDIGTLLDDPVAMAILMKHVPDLVKSEQIQMARSMTLSMLQRYSPDTLSNQTLKAIDSDLANVPVKK